MPLPICPAPTIPIDLIAMENPFKLDWTLVRNPPQWQDIKTDEVINSFAIESCKSDFG